MSIEGERLAVDPTQRDATVVSCDGVSRTFGNGPGAVVAVHGTTCSIPPRARIALVGPSGSGKSTLLHLMAGLERPTTGHVAWPSLSGDLHERASQIAIVFQSPSLVPTLDVIENVALPLDISGTEPRDICERVRDALATVGVADLAAKLPEELSGGQAQRVAVARVLAQRPRLLLADEPTGSLDHDTGTRVVTALLAAADRLGAALVITTHDTSVADRLTTRWSMHEGRLVTSGGTP